MFPSSESLNHMPDSNDASPRSSLAALRMSLDRSNRKSSFSPSKDSPRASVDTSELTSVPIVTKLTTSQSTEEVPTVISEATSPIPEVDPSAIQEDEEDTPGFASTSASPYLKSESKNVSPAVASSAILSPAMTLPSSVSSPAMNVTSPALATTAVVDRPISMSSTNASLHVSATALTEPDTDTEAVSASSHLGSQDDNHSEHVDPVSAAEKEVSAASQPSLENKAVVEGPTVSAETSDHTPPTTSLPMSTANVPILPKPHLPWLDVPPKPVSPKLVTNDTPSIPSVLPRETTVSPVPMSPSASPAISSQGLPASSSAVDVHSSSWDTSTTASSISPSNSERRASGSSSGVFGSLGKRGLDMMGRLRTSTAAIPTQRKPTLARDASKQDPRRRSMFLPMLMARGDAAAKAASLQTPTRVWLDWLEAPSATSIPRSSKFRPLRSSSMLSSSSSMQSLRQPTSQTSADDATTSLFGLPLHEAVMATRASTCFSPPAPSDNAKMDPARPSLLSRREAQLYCLPRLVMRSIESLEKWGVDEEGIYRISGRSSHSSKLRAYWDVPGADLAMVDIGPADLDVHAVCSVLKMYLRELPEPLVPEDVAQIMDRLCGDKCTQPPLRPDSAMSTTMPRASPAPSPMSEEKHAAFIAELIPLMQRIPYCEWYMLREITEHLGILTQPANVAKTKMTLSNLTLVLAPTLQLSGPLFMTLVQGRNQLFTEETRPTWNADRESSTKSVTPSIPSSRSPSVSSSVSTKLMDAVATSPSMHEPAAPLPISSTTIASPGRETASLSPETTGSPTYSDTGLGIQVLPTIVAATETDSDPDADADETHVASPSLITITEGAQAARSPFLTETHSLVPPAVGVSPSDDHNASSTSNDNSNNSKGTPLASTTSTPVISSSIDTDPSNISADDFHPAEEMQDALESQNAEEEFQESQEADTSHTSILPIAERFSQPRSEILTDTPKEDVP